MSVYALCASDLFLNGPFGLPFYLYGDGIYTSGQFIIAPPRGANVSALQKAFNEKMSTRRVSVEWSIGERSMHRLCCTSKPEFIFCYCASVFHDRQTEDHFQDSGGSPHERTVP